MKKYFLYLIAIILIGFWACEDVMDKRNLNAVDDTIWDHYASAEVYINNLYAKNMPALSLASNAGFSDEGYSSSQNVTDIMYGIVDETRLDAVTVFNVNTFALIRDINIGIRGICNASLQEEEKNRLLGQALFFRAWRNWELVRLYGGIPLILTAQDPFYDNLDVPRSSASKCVESIVADLDLAIAGLPSYWSELEGAGRITRGAAAAFKSRVLLTFASPQFNPEKRIERWEAAYNAAMEAKTILDEAGYGLHPDFNKMFIDNPIKNPEAVLYRNYMANSDYSNAWEATIRPPSGGGNMGGGPTWNLVQAFPMNNGKSISHPESGYDELRYWENRDPRFYATVGYNGAEWEMAGRNSKVLWTLERYAGEQNRTPGTGFYLKKASNPSISSDNTGNCGTPWLEIRYAEVLLNLAEAAYETGKMQEAIDMLMLIRERAGIDPAENYGLGNLIDIEVIMRERQIEFAFENKRYWDLCRRKMFTEDLGPNTPKLNGTKRKGLRIQGAGQWNRIRVTSGEYAGWRLIDTAVYFGHVDINRPGDYEEYFAVELKNMDNLQVSGADAVIDYPEICYFFGIQQSILNRSPAIEQTIGWQYGTFDPLKD